MMVVVEMQSNDASVCLVMMISLRSCVELGGEQNQV